MSVVVSTYKLSKTYRTGFWKTTAVCALDCLNLEVHENEIFGYLGPNGAGKSTTLKLLTSLIHPTSGRAEVLGEAVSNPRSRGSVGYLPENPYFYEHLTAEEFLSYCASLFDFSHQEIHSRVGHYLRLTDIYHVRKMQLRRFSKGMLQRVGIAQALINDPKIVLLDEPMSGLDPIGRRQVRDLILQLKREGKTVFFSSHILNDVETLCDRVAILNRGKLIGSGSLNDLISQEVRYLEVVVAALPLEKISRFVPGGIQVTQSGTTTRLEFPSDAELASLVSEVEMAGGHIVSINPVRESMENYFFKLLEGSRPNASSVDCAKHV